MIQFIRSGGDKIIFNYGIKTRVLIPLGLNSITRTQVQNMSIALTKKLNELHYENLVGEIVSNKDYLEIELKSNIQINTDNYCAKAWFKNILIIQNYIDKTPDIV